MASVEQIDAYTRRIAEQIAAPGPCACSMAATPAAMTD